MKTTNSFLFLAAITIASAARAESFGYGRFSRSGGGTGFVQGQSQGVPQGGFHGHGGHHGPPLTDSQRQAFHACLSQNGITPPQPPQLSAEQQSALQSCRASSSSPDAFHGCLQSSGVPMPARPEPTSAQRQVFESCRQSAMQGS